MPFTRPVLWLAAVLTLTEISAAAFPRRVAFLFLIEDSILHEDVWRAFFQSAPRGSYSVYVHPSERRSPTVGGFFASRVLSRHQILPTSWGWLVGGMNALLKAALADPYNEAFVFLSASTLPVKPFRDVHHALLKNSSSQFCVSPADQWLRNQHGRAVKHHQWVVLTRPHAERIASPADGYRFPMGDYGAKCCEDEFAYLAAVLGTVRSSKDSSRAVAIPDINSGHPIDLDHPTEQGSCSTYVWWPDYAKESPFRDVSPDGCALRSSYPAVFTEVPKAFLLRLRASPFLFARKFAANCTVRDTSEPKPGGESIGAAVRRMLRIL